MTVLGAQGVEEGSQQVEDLSLEEVRGLVACVEAVVEGSCCNLEVDRWAVGSWKEEVEGLEVVLQAVDRHGGDMVALAVRS